MALAGCAAPGGPAGAVLAGASALPGTGAAGAVSVLMLRREAADESERLFPALDADITLLPHGDQATLVGLTGVYRTLAGTPLDRSAVRGVAAVTIRTLLSRIADVISDPAAPPGGETGTASIAPGRLACTSGRGLLLRTRLVGGQPTAGAEP